jgi:hypothetical protein
LEHVIDLYGGKKMRLNFAHLSIVVIISITGMRETGAIEPVRTDDLTGESPTQLAQRIAGTGVVLETTSVSTTINDSDNGFPNTFTGGIGHFTEGMTTPNTPLPNVNGGPAATYAGGIDIDIGVCLSTGQPNDVVEEPPARGIGVEGPNNGMSLDLTATNAGEISTVAHSPTNDPDRDVGKDADFVFAVFGHLDEEERPGGGDAAVLKFDVTLASPGFLRISFVFGSDEAPFFLNQPFNDSFAILVDDENIATT